MIKYYVEKTYQFNNKDKEYSVYKHNKVTNGITFIGVCCTEYSAERMCEELNALLVRDNDNGN